MSGGGSEAEYRALIEAAPIGIYRGTPAGEILEVNRAFVQMLGYDSVDEVRALHIPDDLYWNPAERVPLIASLRKEGVLRNAEVRLRKKDGSLLWVQTGGRVVGDATNGGHYELFLVDITARKLALEMSARLAAIVESSEDAILSEDLEGNILTWNAAAQRMFGYHADEIVGRSMALLAPPERRDESRDYLVRVARGEAIHRQESVRRRKDGALIEVSLTVSPVPDATGRIVGASVIARDITEKKATERALAESRAFLERAQEVAHIGSWQWDVQSGRVVWSAEVYRIFGLVDRDVTPDVEVFFEYVHPDDRNVVQEALSAALVRGESYDIDHRVVRPDGEVVWVHGHADLTRDKDGLPQRMVGTTQDITSRKALEAELLQSQKIEAVGRLAGGIAHDFNNLLGVIAGYTEMAVHRLDREHPVQRKLEQVLKAADRAKGLTMQLLAFSRKQVLQPEALDVSDVVRDLSSMLQRVIGEHIQLETHLQSDLWALRADRNQLEQALLNMAVNARDAMPRGGRMTIQAENASLSAEAVAREHLPLKPGRYVRLTVADTGVGMAPGIQTRIFEPFFTTKDVGKGTGLGLSMVYGFVKQSGGFVGVASAPGEGTKFDIYLPGVREHARASAAAPAPPPAVGGTETILLVEDAEGLREFSRESLQESGYQVLAADTGAEGVRLAAVHRATIHLVLTDVLLPDIAGPEVVRQVRRVHASARALFMSGYMGDEILEQEVAKEEGAFLQKPFGATALLQKVRQVLDA